MQTFQTHTVVPKFDPGNFRLKSDRWASYASPSGFRFRTNRDGHAFEIANGPYAGQQHFSSPWTLREILTRSGRRLPTPEEWESAMASDPSWADKSLPLSGSVRYSGFGYAFVGIRGYYWTERSDGTFGFLILGHGAPSFSFPSNLRLSAFAVRCVQTEDSPG